MDAQTLFKYCSLVVSCKTSRRAAAPRMFGGLFCAHPSYSSVSQLPRACLYVPRVTREAEGCRQTRAESGLYYSCPAMHSSPLPLSPLFPSLPFCLLSSLTNSLSLSLPLALPSLSRATKCLSIRMVSVQWDCISFSLWIKHSICLAFSGLWHSERICPQKKRERKEWHRTASGNW